MGSRSAEQWVKKATANGDDYPDRPVLCRIHSDAGTTVATDAFRLHAVNKGMAFPDYKEMIRREILGKDGLAVYINPQYLKDALPDGDDYKGAVVLRVLGPGKPVEIGWTDKSGNHRYATIMPMEMGHIGRVPEIPWRPTDDDAIAEAEDIVADEEE